MDETTISTTKRRPGRARTTDPGATRTNLYLACPPSLYRKFAEATRLYPGVTDHGVLKALVGLATDIVVAEPERLREHLGRY